MQRMTGPNGLLTILVGFGSIIPMVLFVIFISRLVLKDWTLMDRQGWYLNYLFIHRKRDIKILISLRAVGFFGIVTTAFLSRP